MKREDETRKSYNRLHNIWHGMKQKYILVQWPESQMLMDNKRFNECLLVIDIHGHKKVGTSAYMCPENLYKKIFKI